MAIEITYLGQKVAINSGETVLDALLRCGITIPYSCKSGVCQSCITRAASGNIPKKSQDGLKESLRQDHHFLPCICFPESDLVCQLPNTTNFSGPVCIIDRQELAPDIVRVRVSRPNGFEFHSGQFVTLRRLDGIARSYSIASTKADREFLDLHVKRVHQGVFSSWLLDIAPIGETLILDGPKGDCRYFQGFSDEPLLLIGSGTGLGALFGIAREALEQGHSGKITLVHIARSKNGLYLNDELRRVSSEYPNFNFFPCVSSGAPGNGVISEDPVKFAVDKLDVARKSRAYLCGYPAIVQSLKRKFFLEGVSLSRIHADPFIGSEN